LIDQRFIEFNTENPHVYRELVTRARHVHGLGRRCSIKHLFEILRYDHLVSIHGDGEFALSNSYTASYARLIMQREPDLVGFFEIRSLRSTKRTAAADDDYNIELDPPFATHSGSSCCPKCGATTGDDCHCEPERIEERYDVAYEGWDSRSEWR
jgi:hypothetical protein